jgi:hypothetical protein
MPRKDLMACNFKLVIKKFMKNLSVINGTEETTIAYTDYGAGDPVILISGWPLSKEMWEYQIDTIVNNGLRYTCQ